MPKRFGILMLLLLLSGPRAGAQHPDDEYYPYAGREEPRAMLETDSMLFYQQEACRYAEQGDEEREKLLCYANLADAYKFGGDLSMSAMTYRQAIALADSIQVDTASYIPVFSGLSAVFQLD